MASHVELLVSTERGLWCEAGGFFVDPWSPRPGDRAIITHSHSDHARAGAESYLTANSGVDVLRLRIGAQASITGAAFGEQITLGQTQVSLHPAGHVLGSAMVRIEHRGEVWLASGDYKTQADCSGEAIDIPSGGCDVFITESTFGLPVFRWQPRERIAEEMNAWWHANAQGGVTSLVYGYALGKAQSILSLLDPTIGPILTHGAVERFLPAYRAAGVKLPATRHADEAAVKGANGRALIVAPPSAARSPWMRKFGDSAEAMASGWMRIRGRRRRRAIDRGFVLSDHADWDGLLSVIHTTGASRVLVTHGYSGVLARWLRERGLDARPLSTTFVGESGDDTPAGGGEDSEGGPEQGVLSSGDA